MRPYELPLIEGKTPEEQLKQIKSYLYRQAENLNYNLRNSDVTSIWRQTAEALSVSDNDEVEQMRRDEFQALRGLIIKSATSVIKNEDSFSAHFTGNYIAESDYGSFTEEGSLHINGNPYTIGQIYKYQAEIITDVNKYKTELEGYIRTGVLERETSSPVFGLEIGYNKNTYTINGEEYKNEKPVKIRVTPVKIGFYQGDYEVAYLQNSAIYFPAAHITGGSIEIGDNFSVDNEGNMVASTAKIEGEIVAKSGYMGGFAIRSSSDMPGGFWPCSLSSVLTPTDSLGADDYQYVVFMRGNYDDNGKEYGAISITNTVFGVKKRAFGVDSWDNEVSPYVYKVNVKGDVFCQSVTCSSIDAEWITADDDIIVVGDDGRRTVPHAAYTKRIMLATSDEIFLGMFAYKAKNVYLLASETIRIGQHTSASSSSGTDAPPTKNLVLEASTSFRLGLENYSCATANFFAKAVNFSSQADPANTFIVNAKDIYIGKKNSSLTSNSITLAATAITFTDATYSYTWAQIVKAILDLQAQVK